jgi:hypothetical protein
LAVVGPSFHPFGCFFCGRPERVVQQLLDFVVRRAVDFQHQGHSAEGFPLGRGAYAVGHTREVELLALGQVQ